MNLPDLHSLEKAYRQMTDGELLQWAADMDSLTDAGRTALAAEIRSRNLDVTLRAAELYRELSDAEILRSEAKRPAEVTMAGRLLFLLSVGWLVWVAWRVLIMRRLLLTNEAWLSQPPFRGLLLPVDPRTVFVRYGISVALHVALAAWGIATAVGILRLRPWARTSALVICSLVAYQCLGATLMAWLLGPRLWLEYATSTSFVTGKLVAFGFAGLAACGLILFASENWQQLFEPRASSTNTARPASVTCIAIWLVAGWPLMILLRFAKVRSSLLFPAVPFAWLLSAWRLTAFQCVAASVGVAFGVGLFRMKSWARAGVLGLCIIGVASALTLPLDPPRFAMGLSRTAVALLSLWEVVPAVLAAWVLSVRKPAFR